VVAEHAERLWKDAACAPLLSSFRTESLAGAMAAAPKLPRALLLDSLREGCFDQAQELGCVALICRYTLWDAGLVAQAHALGLRALSYTVNDATAADALLALGTDGIITDRVDLFSPAA
ncbi:MAG: glycerophosphodiester phosphodiesterase family protein, partial [Giesbergeria sp.]